MSKGTDWDVFVSHNRKDKPWVRETVQDWRNRGLKVFFDEDTIEPGANVVEALEDGLERSAKVVLIISPSSVGSRWVAMESAAAIFSDPDSLQRRLIPVLLEPINVKRIRLFVRSRNIVDLTNPKTREAEYNRLLKCLHPSSAKPCCVARCPKHRAKKRSTPSKGKAGVSVVKRKSFVELRIERPFDTYSKQDERRLIQAIRAILHLDGEIHIVAKQRGSVRLLLELPANSAEILIEAFESGVLKDLGVVAALRSGPVLKSRVEITDAENTNASMFDSRGRRKASVAKTVDEQSLSERLPFSENRSVCLAELGLLLAQYHLRESNKLLASTLRADGTVEKYLKRLRQQMLREYPILARTGRDLISFFEGGKWPGKISLKEAVEIGNAYRVPVTMILPLGTEGLDAKAIVHHLPSEDSVEPLPSSFQLFNEPWFKNPQQCEYFLPPARLARTNMSLTLLRLRQGQRSEEYFFPGSEIVYVLRGTVHLYLRHSGTRMVLGERDFAHFASEDLHYLEYYSPSGSYPLECAEVLSVRLFKMGSSLQALTAELRAHFDQAFAGLSQRMRAVPNTKLKSTIGRKRTAKETFKQTELNLAREKFVGKFTEFLRGVGITPSRTEDQRPIADPVGLANFLSNCLSEKQSNEDLARDADRLKGEFGFRLSKDQFRRLRSAASISRKTPGLLAYLSKVIRTAPSAGFAQFLFPPVNDLLVLDGSRVEPHAGDEQRKRDYDWQLLDRGLTNPSYSANPKLVFSWQEGETFFFPRCHLSTADISCNLVTYEPHKPPAQHYRSHQGFELIILVAGRVCITFKSGDLKPLELGTQRAIALFDSSIPHAVCNTGNERAAVLIIRFLE